MSLHQTHPHLGDSIRTCLTQLAHRLKPLSVAVIHKQLAWAYTVDFPKISEKSTNSKQMEAGLGAPHSF